MLDAVNALVLPNVHHIGSEMGEQLAQEAHPGRASVPAPRRSAPEPQSQRSFTATMRNTSMGPQTLPVTLPSMSARPATMDVDDVRAYAVLGYLQAHEHASSLSLEHANAYRQVRSHGAAIDGIYAFWPLSRRSMWKVFQGVEPTDEGITRVQQQASDGLYQRALDPEAHAIAKERIEHLCSALAQLSASERALIEYLYEIPLGSTKAAMNAAVDGVHRSTISRRHAKVLSRLRALIKAPLRPIVATECLNGSTLSSQ